MNTRASSNMLSEWAAGVRLLYGNLPGRTVGVSFGLPAIFVIMVIRPVEAAMFGAVSVLFVGWSTSAAAGIDHGAAPALAFLQVRPLRVSGKALVLPPLFAFNGALIAALGLHHHAPLGLGLTIWGWSCWALAVGRCFPGLAWRRLLVWLTIGGAVPGLLTSMAHEAPGDERWVRSAIVALLAALLGWLISPRHSTGSALGRKANAPMSPTAARSAALQEASVRRTATTVLAPVRAAPGTVNPLRIWKLLAETAHWTGSWASVVMFGSYGSLLALADWKLAFKSESDGNVLLIAFTPNLLIFSFALVSSSARPSLDFLRARPFGRWRILAATMLPATVAILLPAAALIALYHSPT